MNTSSANKDLAFINGIIAEYFGQDKVDDPKIPVTATGWYWADKSDNYRYEDWTGPFLKQDEALKYGRYYREQLLALNWDSDKVQKLVPMKSTRVNAEGVTEILVIVAKTGEIWEEVHVLTHNGIEKNRSTELVCELTILASHHNTLQHALANGWEIQTLKDFEKTQS